MLELEKYKGPGSRHTCPACGRKKKLTRYIDSETGRYLADHVGRCDRESTCRYHFKPKEYFAANPHLRDGNGWSNKIVRKPKIQGMVSIVANRENGIERNYEGRMQKTTAGAIETGLLLRTLTNYSQNAFVQFLLGLFPNDPEDVMEAVKNYMIGTARNGRTIFWQIDQTRAIRTGKIIEYDLATGKRRKDVNPNWTHAQLKKAGLLNDDFELRQCFFGEHLLANYPGLPIAITEAEKSAVIGSICKGVFPDMVWLACGGKSNLNGERLARLKGDRTIILYPDADGFDKWQIIASDAVKSGLRVKVSDLIENSATDAEKAKGYDLADYLIREQARRNDPMLREAFRTLIEDRLEIVRAENGMSEDDAEAEIISSGFYQIAIRSVLEP